MRDIDRSDHKHRWEISAQLLIWSMMMLTGDPIECLGNAALTPQQQMMLISESMWVPTMAISLLSCISLAHSLPHGLYLLLHSMILFSWNVKILVRGIWEYLRKHVRMRVGNGFVLPASRSRRLLMAVYQSLTSMLLLTAATKMPCSDWMLLTYPASTIM